jgi:HTH-type transcriptional regulator, cell division transcriptional repressor
VSEREKTAEPRNRIGGRVREARRRAEPRVTQLDLVARLKTYGVDADKTTISKIEHGTRSVTDIEVMAIAASLFVPASWLLGEDEFWHGRENIPAWPQARRR